MLIHCPNGAKKIKFIPESKYDNFVLGRLKGRLENSGVPCEMMFGLDSDKKKIHDLKGITISKDDLMTLLVG